MEDWEEKLRKMEEDWKKENVEVLFRIALMNKLDETINLLKSIDFKMSTNSFVSYPISFDPTDKSCDCASPCYGRFDEPKTIPIHFCDHTEQECEKLRGTKFCLISHNKDEV